MASLAILLGGISLPSAFAQSGSGVYQTPEQQRLARRSRPTPASFAPPVHIAPGQPGSYAANPKAPSSLQQRLTELVRRPQSSPRRETQPGQAFGGRPAQPRMSRPVPVEPPRQASSFAPQAVPRSILQPPAAPPSAPQVARELPSTAPLQTQPNQGFSPDHGQTRDSLNQPAAANHFASAVPVAFSGPPGSEQRGPDETSIESAWMPTGRFVDEEFTDDSTMVGSSSKEPWPADAIEIVPPMVGSPAPQDLAPPAAPPLRQASLGNATPLPTFAEPTVDERSVLNRPGTDSLPNRQPLLSRNELRARPGSNTFQDQEPLPAPDQFPGTQELGDLQLTNTGRSCDDFRERLLGHRIQDIALDISPPKSVARTTGTITRDWSRRDGESLGNGTMVDMRRGFVILDTEQGQEKIAVALLGDADLAAVADYWNIPVQCTIGFSNYEPRSWVPQTMTWKASGLSHKPLYFENVQLERYGHTHGPFTEPVHSTVHFFSSLIVWPYNTAIHPINECQYALGYYRPGNCAPWLKDPVPLSLRGSLRQALVIAGFAGLP